MTVSASLRRVVMAGPLPPAVGGMASVLGALAASSLARQCNLQLFETGKTTPVNRALSQGVKARLKVLRAWWREMGGNPKPIAHIHTCSGLTYFLDGALLILAKARGAPTILHIHGARFDSFLDELSTIPGNLARWIARSADLVVVLSDEWRTRLGQRLPSARIEVVANGVLIPSVVRKSTPVAAAPRFLFLGNLGRRKGVPALLAAVARSSSSWTLDMAGGEEEAGYLAWTRAEVERSALCNRVRVLGPVVGDAKAELMANADGFVLPSNAEGLPMALLEAMAYSLPVVVTCVGAMPEVVRDGIDGIVIPPDDAQALAAALDELADSAELRHAMGEAAKESCNRQFGIERMAESLAAIYSKIEVSSS